MKKMLIVSVLVLGLMSVVFWTVSDNVSAAGFDLLSKDLCTKGADTAACQGQTEAANGNPISGDDGLLSRIANIVALVAGAAAVIVIILGGLRYVTANGDAGAIKNARSMVIGALIGLAVIALARAIIYFVVSKL